MANINKTSSQDPPEGRRFNPDVEVKLKGQEITAHTGSLKAEGAPPDVRASESGSDTFSAKGFVGAPEQANAIETGGAGIRSSVGNARTTGSADGIATGPTSNAEKPAENPVPEMELAQDPARTEDIAEKDALSRDKIASALSQLLISRRDDKPMTIGLFGPWGAGKSTLISLVRREIANSSTEFQCADFNAWKNERVDNMGAALAQNVVDALVADLGFWGQLIIALKTSARRKARVRRALEQSFSGVRDRTRYLLTYVVPFAWPISLLLLTIALAWYTMSSRFSSQLSWLIGGLGVELQ